MADNVVTISSYQIPNCQIPGTVAYLDLYYSSDWVDSQGQEHLFTPLRVNNQFAQRINLTILGGQVSWSSFQTYATLNATVNNTVTVAGIIRDQNFNYVRTLFSGWFIPPSTTPYSFQQLVIINQGRALFLPPSTYLDQTGVIALGDQRWGQFAKMSDSIYGIGRLSVPAANSLDPIVVGDRDPRLGSWINILTYGAALTNTAAQNTSAINNAITAAAAIGGGIFWPAGFMPVNSLTVSVPCLFAPGNSGLQVVSGQTVTFQKSLILDSSKHFDNALAGQGTVAFSIGNSIPELRPEWWGAAGDAVTDDTAAIKACVVAAGPTTHRQVRLSSATYLVTDTIFISADGVVIRGEGFYTSLVQFNPSSFKTCFLVANGGATVSWPVLDNFALSSTNTVQKIGVSLSDCTEASITNFKINGFQSTSKNSIGLQVKGRQLGKFDRLTISADIPISIEENPNVNLDCDHHHFSNLYLIADVTQPCIKVADGVIVSNLLFDGYQAWIQGKYGFYWSDTSVVAPNLNFALTIKNPRWEQNTDDTGYLIYLSHNSGMNGVLIENTLGGGVHGNQFYFRKVYDATLVNTYYQGSLIALNADSTCGVATAPFLFINPNWGSGTLITGGFIYQNGTTNSGSSFRTLNLANNGQADLLFAIADGVMSKGVVLVIAGGGSAAYFNVQGTNHAVTQITTNTNFSTTQGTGGKTNVYWSAGNNRYEIENKQGIGFTFSIYLWLDPVNS